MCARLVFSIIFLALVFSQQTLAGVAGGIPLVPKQLVYWGAKQLLPPSFFRHARWAAPARSDYGDVPIRENPLTDEEFELKFAPISRERAIEVHYLVGVLQLVCREHDIKALPVGGTMLGMLRNQGQLPHDDDADFAVTEHDYARLLGLRKELTDCGVKLRSMPGVGVQLCLVEDTRTWSVMGGILARNQIARGLQKAGLPISNWDLTKRGFIDILPVARESERSSYRYVGEYAEDIWRQQEIPAELMEGQYRSWSFGPMLIQAPVNRKLLEENILGVYPQSLDYIMQTPNHSGQQSVPDQELVRLTEKQKQPFSLTSDDLQQLRQRLGRFKLKLSNRGIVERCQGREAGGFTDTGGVSDADLVRRPLSKPNIFEGVTASDAGGAGRLSLGGGALSRRSKS